MDADKLTNKGGWTAPLGEGADWLDIPAISTRRGGIQFPTNIASTIRFFELRTAWWRRWVVTMDHQRTWMLYGVEEGSGKRTPIARFWRQSKARELVKTLSVAAGKR